MLSNLPFGLQPEDIIILLAALSAVLTVLAIWSALTPRDVLTARARALAERRDQLKAAALAPRRLGQNARAVSIMRSVVTRLNLMRDQQATTRGLLLARAGFRSNDAMIAYLFARMVMPAVGGAVAAFLVFGAKLYGGPAIVQWGMVMAGTLIGFYLPDIYLKNLAQKRQQKMAKALPDALDLMVICAEAGLSLDSTLQRVAKELARSWPELADEYSLTSVEIGFLPDRRQALENLSARTDLVGIRMLVNSLAQTEKYGTPLADSMRVMAAELRNERLMKAEEKAARLPVILTVPMMIFILPPLFIVLIGPGIIQIIDGLSTL